MRERERQFEKESGREELRLPRAELKPGGEAGLAAEACQVGDIFRHFKASYNIVGQTEGDTG